ncbi:hypothetical protein ACFQPF_13085 [Fictibacillus iocasae]|uniref:Uncharacterized protein n=1 Tax=Fictibacillus iocasae TaxID=2715437 RepID=A0ABW2NS94_9BACL
MAESVTGLTIMRFSPGSPIQLKRLYAPTIPLRKSQLNTAASPLPASTPTKQKSISIAATVLKRFKGISDTGVLPPDTMGAVGLAHFVTVVNGRLTVSDKVTGAQLSSSTLDFFWQPTGVIGPGTEAFDPKILYDRLSNRFYIVSLAGFSAPNSWLLVGVSQPGNPLSWVLRAIDADKFGSTQTNSWADYPSIGIDNQRLYVTANMFFNTDEFDAVKVWIFNKTSLFTPGSITWNEFYNPPGAEFTTQPTQVFTNAVTPQYLVSQLSLNKLQLARITFPSGVPVWTKLQVITIAPLSSPFPPNAPQKGTSFLINTGDSRLLQAINRNGWIWTTHTVSSADGNRSEVAWYQLGPTRTTPVQQGRVRNTVRSYYYPSLAVNSVNNVLIGFSGSSPNEFANAFFTSRLASDALGTTRPVIWLKNGLAPYELDRWGDYSATMNDPSDDTVFWTTQEYTLAPDTWGTWWGAIRLP